MLALPLVDGRLPKKFADVGKLVLAVEVLSPSTARHDHVTKRRVYQQEGVDEYWIVDPDARTVERWRPSDERPEVLIDAITWQPNPGHEPLHIDLAALFRESLD